MANGREDPLIGCQFSLEVQGVIQGYFTEVSGLGSEHEIIEHKVVDSAGRDMVMKIPGRLKWGDVTLKRGITSNLDVWDWRRQVEDGDVEGARSNGSIIMYDQTKSEVARWNFEKAWPSKVTGPALKSDSNDIGIEEMVIVHEGIKRVN
jgi:phage tail-like protein